MEKYIWRLLTAMFLLLVAVTLGVLVYVCQGIVLITGICVYGSMLFAFLGIVQGVQVMIDSHRESKKDKDA